MNTVFAARTLGFFLAILCALPAQEAQEAAPPSINGRLEVKDGQRTLHLWGTPTERGFAHGYLLARELLSCAEEDFAMLLQRAGVSPRVYERVLLRGPVAKFSFDEEESAEMAGMLAGLEAALPKEEDRTLNILGRPIKLDDLKAINTVGDWSALGCSTIALSGAQTASKSPAAVRNFDYPAIRGLTELQHVVVVRPSEAGAIAYIGISHPGGIGILTALNAEGVFVSIHDVPVKPTFIDATRANVPRLCALRRLAKNLNAADAITKAEALLKSWPTLYGNNILVTTKAPAEGEPFAAVFEYDKRERLTEGLTRRIADNSTEGLSTVVACTNHHRLRGLAAEESPERCWRYDRLLKAAYPESEVPKPFDLAALKSLVEEAALPLRPRVQAAYGHGTLHQVIAETGSGLFHVRRALVGQNIRDLPWQTFDLTALLKD